MADLFGCIEAGGTKFIVGLARGPDAIHARTRIDTGAPAATIGAAIEWLTAQASAHGKLAAIGIASFGPLEASRDARDWGRITNTPKPGWADTDLAGPFSRHFAVPVGFDTDVNGAALAEARWGVATCNRSVVYVTVGTGIGGGCVIARQIMRGASHPEMGHFKPKRHPDDQDFEGICSFHGDCIEGLASGPAIKARWGKSLSELPHDHPAHTIIADYLGQLATAIRAMLAPGRIIMGGGVMGTPGLIDRIRAAARHHGAGYFPGDEVSLIAEPGLGPDSGLLGAMALAEGALSSTA